MKVLILYRPHSEHSRMVEEFAKNLQQNYPDSQLLLSDVDSLDGMHQAELYDIMEYPAVMVLSNDGGLLHSWVGEHIPLVDDVAGYLRS